MKVVVESDALAIARWCWPEHAWKETKRGDAERADDESIWFSKTSYDDTDNGDRGYREIGVAEAERILIERGHADEYGAALAMATHGATIGDSEAAPQPQVYARIATTALCIRVHAMAEVVRKLQ